jgi:hypothetical protein
MTDKQIIRIQNNLDFIRSVYQTLITILPSFNITDEEILPYGLKPHTRSVSWIVEQVVTQQTKYRKEKLGLKEVNIDVPDTCLHDCEIQSYNDRICYVNVKIHNIINKENKNDIAAVEKLYMQYNSNPQYDLIYACFGISFKNVNIRFHNDYLEVFSPQFLPIYVNPRNDKIQAYYKHEPVLRSRSKFLKLLKEKSKSIVL